MCTNLKLKSQETIQSIIFSKFYVAGSANNSSCKFPICSMFEYICAVNIPICTHQWAKTESRWNGRSPNSCDESEATVTGVGGRFCVCYHFLPFCHLTFFTKGIIPQLAETNSTRQRCVHFKAWYAFRQHLVTETDLQPRHQVRQNSSDSQDHDRQEMRKCIPQYNTVNSRTMYNGFGSYFLLQAKYYSSGKIHKQTKLQLSLDRRQEEKTNSRKSKKNSSLLFSKLPHGNKSGYMNHTPLHISPPSPKFRLESILPKRHSNFSFGLLRSILLYAHIDCMDYQGQRTQDVCLGLA